MEVRSAMRSNCCPIVFLKDQLILDSLGLRHFLALCQPISTDAIEKN
jgi:hypothetical protein